ncbi:LysR family transcriptional regulator [Salmonella enterica subsp. enterica]|uniref:LysR family transcriptional regulator n=1 Tax=Salmonella enterica I TaxID=59201 RepID=A0A3S4IMY5_SALET|nr:LysR family transcriptional regulator [Salmonella enterica subsp. enterica]SUG89429.1 LysR family transcriptional regulator [Salmonella enterica subsp. enterica]VEB62079.1 LysR family transcriptional regulator [Salmonella enterica subsp. enterica]
MELRQLRYFVRIIETGSMGSAAQDLDIGVSALSQQMSRLENELAIRLLQRTSRGVTPTNAGLAFYSQAQLALRHADDAILAAREARLSGHVSVGMAPQYRLHTGYTVYPCHAGKLCRCPTACGGKLVR